MILSIAQICMKPHQRHLIFCVFLEPTTKGFLVEFWVGIKSRHTCITYFVKLKNEPLRDASHTLWSRRASVWNFYNFLILNIFVLLWIMNLSLFGWVPFIWKYELSLFLSFFSSCSLACIYFLSCLLAWIFFFSFSF